MVLVIDSAPKTRLQLCKDEGQQVAALVGNP